jgi:hypothetical protein
MFYVPTAGPDDWRKRLAQPERHWAVGRSAMMLALCWETAAGFPPEVAATLETASTTEFEPFEFLIGFPEHKTPLPGGSRASQSDILVVAVSGQRLAVIAVEGKVDEGFDRPLSEWLGPHPSPGKLARLEHLCAVLGLSKVTIAKTPYQLVHRTAAAAIEASRLRAVPVMLVHSWGLEDEGFADYARLTALLGGDGRVGCLTRGALPNGGPILLGWVRGDDKWRTVEA